MHNEHALDSDERALIQRCPDIEWVETRISTQTAASLPLIAIQNALCRGSMTLQGGQVLSFKPDTGPDLLWVSPRATAQPGTAIRGGIPICLPWFGVNRFAPDKPKHGFARISRWRLESAATAPDGSTHLTLGLRQFRRQPHPLFEHCFEACLEVRFAKTLRLSLQVHNRSSQPMPLSWALHSYHPTQNLDQMTVTGLRGTVYLDNTRGLARTKQQEDPRFSGEFDRVYLSAADPLTIVGDPSIEISASNAPTAIVWNPGAVLASEMADLGENAHQHFVCVERGAAFDNEQLLAPGAALQASVTIAAAHG